jgi:hypothetical protein
MNPIGARGCVARPPRWSGRLPVGAVIDGLRRRRRPPQIAANRCDLADRDADSSPKNPQDMRALRSDSRAAAAVIAQPRQLFEGKKQGVKPASKSRVLPPLALRPGRKFGSGPNALAANARAATGKVASDLVLTAY